MQSYNSKMSSPKVKKKEEKQKSSYVSYEERARIEWEANQLPIPKVSSTTKIRDNENILKVFTNFDGDEIKFIQPTEICSKIYNTHNWYRNGSIEMLFGIWKNDELMFDGELFDFKRFDEDQLQHASKRNIFTLRSLNRPLMRNEILVTYDMQHLLVGEHFHRNNIIAGFLVEITKLNKIVDIRTMVEPECIIKNPNVSHNKFYDVKKATMLNDKIIFSNGKKFVYLDCITMESSEFGSINKHLTL